MTQKERMLTGKLYTWDEELARDHARKDELISRLSAASPGARESLFRSLFGRIGKDFHIELPFQCDYGSHIYIGDRFYANFDCIILDVCDVTIGDDVFLAPRVSIFTTAHPIDAGVRTRLLEYGRPVTIGSSVWIGGNTVVNPGVTIGDNVVIGSGSVVTKDIPSGVVAAGNPCRVLRKITAEDTLCWEARAAEYDAETAPPSL